MGFEGDDEHFALQAGSVRFDRRHRKQRPIDDFLRLEADTKPHADVYMILNECVDFAGLDFRRHGFSSIHGLEGGSRRDP